MERSAFNMTRTSNFNAIEMQFFERCKEERLTRERGDAFEQLLISSSPLDTNQLSNKQFFIGFIGYIIMCQLRLITEGAVRNRNHGQLTEITGALDLNEIMTSAKELTEKLEKRKRMILKCGSNVGY